MSHSSLGCLGLVRNSSRGLTWVLACVCSQMAMELPGGSSPSWCRLSLSMWTLPVVFAAGQPDFLQGGGSGIPKLQDQRLPGLLKTRVWGLQHGVPSAIAHGLRQLPGPAQPVSEEPQKDTKRSCGSLGQFL